jgi:hypothetical protein
MPPPRSREEDGQGRAAIGRGGAGPWKLHAAEGRSRSRAAGESLLGDAPPKGGKGRGRPNLEAVPSPEGGEGSAVLVATAVGGRGGAAAAGSLRRRRWWPLLAGAEPAPPLRGVCVTAVGGLSHASVGRETEEVRGG